MMVQFFVALFAIKYSMLSLIGREDPNIFIEFKLSNEYALSAKGSGRDHISQQYQINRVHV